MIYAFLNPLGVLVPEDPEQTVPHWQATLQALLAGAELVPVTGLDEEELLTLPASFTSWQVLRRGAVVVTPQGEEDPVWRRLTKDTLRERAETLRLAFQAAQHIGWLGQLGTEATLEEHAGLPLLVTLRHPHAVTAALTAAARELRLWLEEGPFRDDLQLVEEGNTLTLLPREITPESAVNYILSQLGEESELTLGISAQRSDAAFLSLCDLAVTPGEGPILQAALDRPGQEVEEETDWE